MVKDILFTYLKIRGKNMKAIEIISKYIEKKMEIDPEIKRNYEERNLTPERCYEALENYARSTKGDGNSVVVDDKTAFALIDAFIEKGTIEGFTPPLTDESDAFKYYETIYKNKENTISEEKLKEIEENVKKEILNKKIEEAKKKAYEKEKRAFEKEEKKKEEIGQLSLFDL